MGVVYPKVGVFLRVSPTNELKLLTPLLTQYRMDSNIGRNYIWELRVKQFTITRQYSMTCMNQ